MSELQKLIDKDRIVAFEEGLKRGISISLHHTNEAPWTNKQGGHSDEYKKGYSDAINSIREMSDDNLRRVSEVAKAEYPYHNFIQMYGEKP